MFVYALNIKMPFNVTYTSSVEIQKCQHSISELFCTSDALRGALLVFLPKAILHNWILYLFPQKQNGQFDIDGRAVKLSAISVN